MTTARRHAITLACASALALLAAPPSARADEAASYFRAIRQNDDAAIARLLAHGLDPNVVDEKGTSGLHLALSEELPRAAHAILASPLLRAETRNHADESPLMMAAIKGYADLARLLIARGAAVNKTGWTPLHYAASAPTTDVLRLLLDAGAAINAPSPNGSTPLMMAAAYGQPQAVRALLDAGANPHARNQQGLNALDFARRANRPDAIAMLTHALAQTPPPAATQQNTGANANTSAHTHSADSAAPAPRASGLPATARQHPMTRGHW